MRTDNAYLYSTWQAMHRRCYNPDYHSYHRYGGRGILVCARWHDYQTFKADIGGSWQKGMTLDRVNNDGNYEPGNVKWVPKGQNTKTKLVEPQDLLKLYNSGIQQKQLAEMFGTDQPHISRILAKARRELS